MDRDGFGAVRCKEGFGLPKPSFRATRRSRSFRCAGAGVSVFVAGVFGVRAGGMGRSSQMPGGAVVFVVVVVVVVVGAVRATGLQFLLCMFSLFFVFLQTEKTFL